MSKFGEGRHVKGCCGQAKTRQGPRVTSYRSTYPNVPTDSVDVIADLAKRDLLSEIAEHLICYVKASKDIGDTALLETDLAFMESIVENFLGPVEFDMAAFTQAIKGDADESGK